MNRNVGKILIFVLSCVVLFYVISLRASQKQREDELIAVTHVEMSAAEPAPTSGPDYGALEITGIMTPEDIAGLESYRNLQRLDLSGSTCYDAILDYISAHPQVEVIYTVAVGEKEYPAAAGTVSLSTADDVSAFASAAGYFQSVELVEITCEDFSPDSLAMIGEKLPDTPVDYSITLNGESVSSADESIDLSGMTPGELSACVGKLALLPKLKHIELMKSDGSTNYSIDDLAVIQAASPGAGINFSFELFGSTVSTADTRLEFTDRSDIGNEGVNQIRAILPYMSCLEYLKLDDCGTDNETMASLRDDFPDIKVVWRVYFSAYGERMDGTVGVYSCLTDTEKVWATGCVHDAQAEALKYCTDVKYLDLGHNCITKIDFVSYMPKLEVAIFAISWLEDLSPIANCPNLEYLEAFSLGDENLQTIDITPIAACTNLKHLNLSNIPRSASNKLSDISPLYDLNLERFYCTMNSVPQEQQDEFIKRHPDCEVEFGNTDPTKTTWRYTDGWTEESTDKAGKKEHRTERYALLCEQIGYDTLDYSKK